MSSIEQEFQRIENEHGWNRLFAKLDIDQQQQTTGKKFETALLHINRMFNRFRDVLPYDDTRVRLKKGSNDYINANYVQIPSANRKYILTQGPLQTTSGHFWQMIWQENSRVIVMLTRLIERGNNKCWLYYPDGDKQNELLFDDVDLKVVFISERQYRHYTQRKFRLIDCSTNESRSIIHWSDFDWPDHSVPKTPEPFLQLIRDVRYSGAFDVRYGAPVLHCSAGIGRSGTFVLVDSILKLFAQSKTANEISLIDIISHIRTQRQGLVQTPEQLRFSYVAIIAGLKLLNEIEENEKPFIEYDFSVSSDSESDDDGNNENEFDLSKSHPKVCGRQDNIMPNSRLSDTLEDINCDLMRRAESNASVYQLTPKSSHRLLALANEQSNHDRSQSTIQDSETTSIRFRQERSIQNENIEKKINEIKTKLQTCSSSLNSTDNRLSLIHLLTTKYRHSFLFGLFTFFTGSFLLFKYFSNNNRNH